MLRERIYVAVFAAVLALGTAMVLVVRDARPAEPKLGWRLEACGGAPYDCRVLSLPLPSGICNAMADSIRREDASVETHCRPVLVNEE